MSLWNGNRGALSLTFDDALPCQLEYAVPVMNAHDIQGTFFAIADCPAYPLDVHGWRKAIPFGHEIGSHSVRHKKAATLDDKSAAYEAKESKRILENHFGVPVVSFCYPYTDAPTHLQKAVGDAGYLQARGGRVARADKFIRPGDGINMLNITCFHVNDGVLSEQGEMWAHSALERNAWVVLMLHGVGNDGNQWDNIFPPAWEKFMKFLQREKERGLWVAPFGIVADNLRSNQ